MVIQSERVWLYGSFFPAHIIVANGRILDIKMGLIPDVDYDYGQRRIVPGFIDIHAHGGWNYDSNENDPAGLRRWASNWPREGVTAFCPTTVTDVHPILISALRNIANVMLAPPAGAEILGIHLEGPFLNPFYRGAQPEKAIRQASLDDFIAYEQAAEGQIVAITLAPEMDPGHTLIRSCKEKNIVVSMGHSDASFDQTLEAMKNGAISVTHVYNGMAKYSNREPGRLGAGWRLDGV